MAPLAEPVLLRALDRAYSALMSQPPEQQPEPPQEEGVTLDELSAGQFDFDDGVAKVSVVGLGMARQTGVADRMFRAVADAGVNILMITTSEIKISVLVQRSEAVDALRSVHQAFRLDEEPPETPALASPAPATDSDALENDAVDILVAAPS